MSTSVRKWRASMRVVCAALGVFLYHDALFSAEAASASPARSTALHLALNNSDATWRSLLTEANVKARDARGNTPLHLAALRNNADAVEKLLELGADAKALNEAQAAPLHYASGNLRTVRALLARGANPNARSSAQMTPLMSAAMCGDSYAVVRLLVEAGATVNSPLSDPFFPTDTLGLAIHGGDRRTVRYLLDHGAAPNSTQGLPPLVMAAFTGDADLVRLLLARGADVNSQFGFYGHALNAALFDGHDAAAAVLLEHGADLTTRSLAGHGTPPSVFAGYNDRGDSTLARLLVSHGADLNSANDAGETALSFALKRGEDTPLVRYLRASGARPPPASVRPKSVPSRELPAGDAARTALVRESAQRAVNLLQRGGKTFLDNGFVREQAKCISCHQQELPEVAFGLARERGLRVDELELGRQLHAQFSIMWGPTAEAARQMQRPFPAAPDNAGFGAEALSTLRFPRDDTIDALNSYVLNVQRPDGSWLPMSLRPPMEDGVMTTTAWAIRALQLYPPAGRDRDVAAALQRARDWLHQQEPSAHNRRVFQLLGLAWSGENPELLRPYARRLQEAQRPDGGWAQLPGLASDAWATGSTLVALNKAGVALTDTTWKRGVEFLLRTQFDDGSWWVRSRTWPFQPHFDGQFPHGKDQWISAGGTAWAAIALLMTLEPTVPAARLANGQELIARYLATGARPAAGEVARTQSPGAANARISFARDVRPIIERSCADCHTGEKIKGNFSLASRDGLLKGGQSGDPAVVPGRSAESHLLRYVTDQVEDLEMPPLRRREKYPALAPAEIEILRTWIDAGAEWDKAQ